MKINTPKKNRKIFLSFAILITIVLIGIGVYIFVKQNTENRRQQESLKSIDANKAQNEKPIQGTSKNSDSSSSQTTDDEKTIVPTDPATNNDGDLEKPVITRAERTGTNVRVSAIFTKPAYGSCTIIFEKQGEKAISRSAQVVVGSSYYSCNGFLIPVSDFSSKGEWLVKVTHENNGKTVTSDTKSVALE